MDKSRAQALAKLLAAYAQRETNFPLLDKRPAGRLQNFHHWADGRPCQGAFCLRETGRKDSGLF